MPTKWVHNGAARKRPSNPLHRKAFWGRSHHSLVTSLDWKLGGNHNGGQFFSQVTTRW